MFYTKNVVFLSLLVVFKSIQFNFHLPSLRWTARDVGGCEKNPPRNTFLAAGNYRKQKAERKFREEIKKGDKVVTTGGIHGKVSSVSEGTVMVDTGEGIKLKIEKSAISLDLSPEILYFVSYLNFLYIFFFINVTV